MTASPKNLNRRTSPHSPRSGPRATPPPSKPEGDLRLPLARNAMLLPWRCDPSAAADDLSFDEVRHAASAVGARPGAFLIGGGEPLKRRDLWELLAELARLRPANLGLCLSGAGLSDALVERLRSVGVQRVHVPFHCARQDAHDWLVGQPGALKAAHRAIRACVDAGLPVTAEIVLTRPTAPHVAETVAVLARSGVRAVCARRLMATDAPGTTFVPLSPRLSLLGPSLERAAAVALERRVRLSLRDLPICVAPRLRPLFAAVTSETWVMPDGSVQLRGDAGAGCPTCPERPQCAGVPQDYVARFGWEEFVDPRTVAVRVDECVDDQKAETPAGPLVFTWRGPHRVRCEACADTAEETPRAVQPYESTREVRARLVHTARYRPAVLRLVGADLLAHPEAAALVYDAVRLFRRVEVAGEASALVEWTDLDLRRLKDLGRIDVALYGPDADTHDAHCGIPGAFIAMQRGIEQLCVHTQIPAGAYAVVHDASMVHRFAEAWSRGRLPGEPRFRLSARGASLDDLVECAQTLPAGAARAALLAVLPRCLCESAGLVVDADGLNADAHECNNPQQRIHCGRSVPYQPGGADLIGEFDACQDATGPCAIPGCVGMAVGWQSTARSNRWMASI